MAYPIALPTEVESSLKRSSSKRLSELRTQLLANARSATDPTGVVAAASLISYEWELREVEPVTRKIARGVNQAVDYCKKNPEKVTQGVVAAAAVVLAVGLGVKITKR